MEIVLLVGALVLAGFAIFMARRERGSHRRSVRFDVRDGDEDR